MALLWKNSNRFSVFTSDQRTKLGASLIRFCISDLAALPLFQDVFGGWIAVDKWPEVIELDTKDLPREVIMLVSSKFTRPIIPVQPLVIQRYLCSRRRAWVAQHFLEHVFIDRDYDKRTKSIFDLLNPKEKQILLSLVHLPRNKELRLPGRFLEERCFIPSGNNLLHVGQVYDDKLDGVGAFVELLGLPRASTFFDGQLAILKDKHPRITLDEVRYVFPTETENPLR